tara:strand:- start:27 stop:707 length:681 start_codon:yes stop_codon:yes gene_type:complete
MAINVSPNLAVSQELADALHDASDHLPVSVNLVFSKEAVFPINNSPVGNDTIFNLYEFPVDNTLVGKVLATDPDGDDITYAIISGNEENFFNIDNEGEIFVSNGNTLSYESYKEFVLIVEVSDGLLKENIQVVINIVELPPLLIESYINKIIKIYPNPFSESFVIDANKKIRDIIVYDIKGRVVLKKNKFLGKHNINLKRDSNGIYIFSFRLNDEIYNIKLIKKGL